MRTSAALAVAAVLLAGCGTASDDGPTVAHDPGSTPSTSAPTLPPRTPVYVDAAGWTCEPPADEKFACTDGQDAVIVNWRPAEEREAYLDPGKADVIEGVHTYVSEAHGKWFATVAPIQGTGQPPVDEIGGALIWAD